MEDFLQASRRGGDAVQPQSMAMAGALVMKSQQMPRGLYLGVLKNSLSQLQSLTALKELQSDMLFI